MCNLNRDSINTTKAGKGSRIRRRIISALLSLAMLSGMLMYGAACEKKDDGVAQSDAAGTKTATTAKGSAVSAKTSTGTGVKTGAVTTAKANASASAGADTQAGSAGAGSEGGGEELADDSAGGSDTADGGSQDTGGGDGLVKEVEIFDLKGSTINIAVYSANQASRTWWETSNYSAETMMFGTRLGYVENKYNCKFVLNNAGAQKTQLILNAIAGTYWNDITFMLGSWLLECDKFLTPLNDLIDLTTTNANINKCIEFVTWNGNYYGIPWQNKVNWDDYIVYNRAILQRESLPDPITLMVEGQWTWEAFLDISVRATKDLNGDGITDQWGLVIDTTGSTAVLAQRMVASNFGGIISREGDSYRFSLGDPRSIKALQLISDIHNIYKSGILNKTSTLFKLGQAAMAVTGGMSTIRGTKTSYPDTSAYVLFPKGPDANRYVNFSRYVGGWAGGIPLVVSKGIGKEKIARLIYDLCALYDPTFPSYLTDVDVISYLPSLFSEEDLKTVILEKSITQTQGAATDIFCYLQSDLTSPVFSASTSLYMKILNENIAASTVIDSYKDMIDAKIYDTVNKYIGK